MTRRTALVVGVTGIAGYNTATALLNDGWEVIGLSRSASITIPGVHHVHADVLDPESIEAAVSGLDISHLFFTTWQRQATGLPKAQAWWTVKRQAMTVDSAPTVGVYFGTTSGEVWGSRDEGRTWKCLARHLPHVYSVEYS